MSLMDSAHKEVERIVSEIVPEGKRAALVFVATDGGGQFMAAAKVGEHWQVAARATTTWKRPQAVTGEVQIVGSW